MRLALLRLKWYKWCRNGKKVLAFRSALCLTDYLKILEHHGDMSGCKSDKKSPLSVVLGKS